MEKKRYSIETEFIWQTIENDVHMQRWLYAIIKGSSTLDEGISLISKLLRKIGKCFDKKAIQWDEIIKRVIDININREEKYLKRYGKAMDKIDL